jgi:hypothetical protein
VGRAWGKHGVRWWRLKLAKNEWGQGVLTHEPDAEHVHSVLIGDGNEKWWVWEVGGML